MAQALSLCPYPHLPNLHGRTFAGFRQGHGFSRAVNRSKLVRLQPPRPVSHPVYPNAGRERFARTVGFSPSCGVRRLDAALPFGLAGAPTPVPCEGRGRCVKVQRRRFQISVGLKRKMLGITSKPESFDARHGIPKYFMQDTTIESLFRSPAVLLTACAPLTICSSTERKSRLRDKSLSTSIQYCVSLFTISGLRASCFRASFWSTNPAVTASWHIRRCVTSLTT